MRDAMKKCIAVTGIAATLVGATASASYALGNVRYWNSSSSPLTVSGYGSTGYGYGNWRVSTGTDGTRSRLSANIRLNNADNHTVYATMMTQSTAGYCAQSTYVGCSVDWYNFRSAETTHYNGSAYRNYGASTPVDSAGRAARALVNVRLDVPWRTDPSSGTTITQADTY